MVVLAQPDTAVSGNIQMWLSYDGGATFDTLVTVHIPDLLQHRAPICTAPGCAIFAALASDIWTFYRTTDYGLTWAAAGQITDGFVERYTLFATGAGGSSFIGCSVDVGEGNKFMYISRDGGTTWTRGGQIAGLGIQLPQRILRLSQNVSPNPAIPDLYTVATP